MLGKGRKSEIYYYQNDHLGTPHSLTDRQGNTVWRR
ncbi:RHS domain-containing protein [Serratia fonticola]